MNSVHQHLNHDEVSAFIDGELEANAALDLGQHLATCHGCAMRVVSAMQLKAATARASERFIAPPEVLSRFAAQLRQEIPKKSASVSPLRSSMWGALAASLILVVSLIGWQETRRSNDTAAELLDQHLAVLASGAVPEIISSDRHTVKPWFQGKLPFSFNLPQALPVGTMLNGGDLTFINGQPAALLLFNVGKHQVSVFLTQRSSNKSAPVPLGIQSGFVFQSASTHDLRISAVSDVAPTDLALLMSALVEAQSPR